VKSQGKRNLKNVDKVLFRKVKNKGVFSKSDLIKPWNEVVIHKDLPGGIYMVQDGAENEVVLKIYF
jgi:uncharacterized membrane protein